MPIWLRNYTFSEIQKWYDKEKKAHEDAAKGKGKEKQTLVNSDGKVNAPAFANASKPFQGKSSYK
jgi:hypothetical protein|tara:strand:- start:11 stop:205 length:195 start_codon:yes stop_codon:yes gene_type:complete